MKRVPGYDLYEEYVEAVPGPAIVISKETYEKMKHSRIDKEKREKLAMNAGRLNITKNHNERNR